MNAEISLGPHPLVCEHDGPKVAIQVGAVVKRVCVACLPKVAAQAVDERRQVIRTAR